MPPDVKNPGPTDGRSTRWSVHRESRRLTFVEAAVAAIDAHGPDAGVEEIATAAGVARTVLYRYFAEKSEIHAAVGRWGAALVMERLLPALTSDAAMRDRVEMAVDAYLGTLEEHPNVFLLLVRYRATDGGDPLTDGKAEIASAISRVMGDALRELGVDAGGAEPWAHGLVGLGLATGEWWLDRHTMSRAHVGSYLTAFVWSALEGISRDQGITLEPDQPLRLVSRRAQEAKS